MHTGCFALEYARGESHFLSWRTDLKRDSGWIPLMMPFGLADTFTSTLDPITMYHTVRITAREMIRNIFIGKI